MRITVDSVMALGPCEDWHRERVEEWFGGRKYAYVKTALRDDAIGMDDRLWLVTCLIGERCRRLFACDCAERALTRERENGWSDERCWEALAVARRYVRGESTT